MPSLNFSPKAWIRWILVLLQVLSAWGNLSQSMVQILQNGYYACAGTLVRDNFVVTAAHCLANGEDSQGVTVWAAVSEVDVSDIFLPDDYDPTTWDMDVAVLKLTTVLWGEGIQVASLGFLSLADDFPIYAHGWPEPVPPARIPMPYLIIEKFYVFERISCQQRYPLLTRHMFCGIQGASESVLRGIGGPVEAQGQLCGLVSFFVKSSNRINPIIFVNFGNENVRKFLNDKLSK